MEDSSIVVAVSLIDAELNESKLNSLTQEVAGDLNRRRGIEAKIADGSQLAGSKGDPMAVGTFVLQLLGSGGAIAVFLNGLKAYFLRKQSLTFEVKRADGAKFTLRAENLSEHTLAATSAQFSDFLKG